MVLDLVKQYLATFMNFETKFQFTCFETSSFPDCKLIHSVSENDSLPGVLTFSENPDSHLAARGRHTPARLPV